MFRIVTDTNAYANNPPLWVDDMVGEPNTTEAEALAAIKELRRLGGDFRSAWYGVRDDETGTVTDYGSARPSAWLLLAGHDPAFPDRATLLCDGCAGTFYSFEQGADGDWAAVPSDRDDEGRPALCKPMRAADIAVGVMCDVCANDNLGTAWDGSRWRCNDDITITEIDPSDLHGTELIEAAATDPEAKAYSVCIKDQAEAAEAVWLPTTGRIAVAWGANAIWSTCEDWDDPEDMIHLWWTNEDAYIQASC